MLLFFLNITISRAEMLVYRVFQGMEESFINLYTNTCQLLRHLSWSEAYVNYRHNWLKISGYFVWCENRIIWRKQNILSRQKLHNLPHNRPFCGITRPGYSAYSVLFINCFLATHQNQACIHDKRNALGTEWFVLQTMLNFEYLLVCFLIC